MALGTHSGAVYCSGYAEAGVKQIALRCRPVKFGTVGDWQLQALVERGGASGKIACNIPVGSPPRRLTGLLPYLALPPVIVALFVANQRLRTQSSKKQF